MSIRLRLCDRLDRAKDHDCGGVHREQTSARRDSDARDALAVAKPIWMVGDSAYDTIDWHNRPLGGPLTRRWEHGRLPEETAAGRRKSPRPAKTSPFTAGVQRPPSSTFTVRRRLTSHRFARVAVRGKLAVDSVFASPKCTPTTPTVGKQLGNSKAYAGTSIGFVATPVADSPRSLDSQLSELT
jgi:hypothetical protein